MSFNYGLRKKYVFLKIFLFRIFGINDRSFNRVVATFAANGLMVNENCLLTTFLKKKKKKTEKEAVIKKYNIICLQYKTSKY